MKRNIRIRKIINFTLIFVIFSIMCNFITIKSANASVYNGKWGKAQIFDCMRRSAGGGYVPQQGYAFTASNFKNIFDSINRRQFPESIWGSNGDRYVKFVSESSKLKLKLYEANGTYVQDISNDGTIYGLDNIGFLYVSDTDYGYFISNSAGYSYGNNLTYTPNIGIATSTDLNNYNATTTVLAAGETVNGSYTVSYRGNGNTGGSVPLDSHNYTNGSSAIVLGNTGNLAKTGYTFDGWNTAANGSGTNYAAGGSLSVSGNVTLYAKWTASSTNVMGMNDIQDITVNNGTSYDEIDLPTRVGIILNNQTTTSVAVTWDNGDPEYNGNLAGTYIFAGTLTMPNGITNPSDLTATVKVIVEAAGNQPTTSAAVTAVTIEGTTKVGQTLTGQLIDENGSKFTTSAAVTYEWYRLDKSNSDFVNKIGGNKTYGLTSSDLNKYIGLRAIYDGNSFDAVSGKILASSSSSSSSSHHNSSTTSTDTGSTSAADTNTTKNDNKTGWSKDENGQWKFVENSGNKATGWKLIDNKWYFFNNKSGTMVTGWYKSESGDWTYNGQDIANQWFYLDKDGKLTIGWYKDTDGNWYYLCDGSQYGALGVMTTGWQFIDGKWYYFNNNGAMASNAVVEGYILGSDGAWIQQ